MTPPSRLPPFRIAAPGVRLAEILEATGLELGTLSADSLENGAPADRHFLAVELSSAPVAESLVLAIARDVLPKLAEPELEACALAAVATFRDPAGGPHRVMVYWPNIEAWPLAS